MKILWDEPKRLANLAKHGLDFAELESRFDFDNATVLTAKQSGRGPRRIRLIGELKGLSLVSIIISPLGREAISIISLRSASQQERKQHVG